MLRAVLNNPQWARSDQLVFCLLLALALHVVALAINGLWPAPTLADRPDISLLSDQASAVDDRDGRAGLVDRAAGGSHQAVTQPRLKAGAEAAEGRMQHAASLPLAGEQDADFALADAGGQQLLLKRQAPLKVFYRREESSQVGFAARTRLTASQQVAGLGGQHQKTAIADSSRLLTVGPDTRSEIALQYVEGWRRWMRANGNLSYPAEARRLGLRGDVLTQVRLNADGSLADVQILRSSGQRLLDEAVLKTTRDARWYLPFPAALSQQYQQLEFSWRWRYGPAQ